MNKKLFSLIVAALVISGGVSAQTFNSVCPSGHTLIYSVNEWDTTTVSVKRCIYYNVDNVELIIPASVYFEGNTYTVTRIDPDPYESITNFLNNHSFKKVTLPSTIRTLDYKAFGGSGITSINLPDSLDTIGSWAFCDCEQLEDVTIPENIKYIGHMAFTNCGSIGTMEVPSNVQTIMLTNPNWHGSTLNSGEVFSQLGAGFTTIKTMKVKNVYYDGSIAGAPWGALHYSTYKEDGLYYADSTKTILYGCERTMTYASIPNTVTTISNYAFFNCRNLWGVEIPSSVTVIGDSAFMGCINLTTLSVPTTVDSIGTDAFYHIEYVNYGGTSAGRPWGAFTTNTDSVYLDVWDGLIYSSSEKKHVIGCITTMGRVVVPESVESIGSNSFELSDLHIIDYYAANCTTALGLFFPENISQIRFFNNSVQTIPDSCFMNCNNVSSLTLPASLTSIGDFAFSGCSSVNSITMLATTPPTISYNTFDGVPTNADVIVPCGSLHAYMADPNWNRFTNIHTVGCPYEVSVAASDTSLGTVMGGGTYMSGDTITISAFPTTRTYFNGWSNGATANPYTFTVISDTSITAQFSPADTTYIDIHDTTYVDVHDTTYIDVHDTTYVDVFVHDTTYIDVHDTTYVDVFVHDTTYIDVPYPVHDTTYVDVPYPVHDTIYVNVPYPVHDTTYIDVPYPVHDTTYVNVPYPVHDTTYVDVPYPVHDTTIVTDTLWLTLYDTVWLHDTIIIHDTIYITQEDIDGTETVNVKVYSSEGQIVVDGADGNTVTLYDVSGRMLATKHDDGTLLRFDVPTSGTYMIKIGNLSARKVVVIR